MRTETKVSLWILAGIVFLMLMSFVVKAGEYSPPCKKQTWIDPNSYPFAVDVNSVIGYPLGYLATDVNDTVGHEIRYCDPDGHSMILDVNNLPANCLLDNSIITWNPQQNQVNKPYYIYITVTDIPGANSLPISTIGTLILYAYERNEPPVIDVCP